MWSNLFVELTGSLVGAFLGFFTAMWVEHLKERKTEKDQRAAVVTTLIAEIDPNERWRRESPAENAIGKAADDPMVARRRVASTTAAIQRLEIPVHRAHASDADQEWMRPVSDR